MKFDARAKKAACQRRAAKFVDAMGARGADDPSLTGEGSGVVEPSGGVEPSGDGGSGCVMGCGRDLLGLEEADVVFEPEDLLEVGEAAVAEDRLPISGDEVEGVGTLDGLEGDPVVGWHLGEVELGEVEDAEGPTRLQVVIEVLDDLETHLVREAVDDEAHPGPIDGGVERKGDVDTLVLKVHVLEVTAVMTVLTFHVCRDVEAEDVAFGTQVLMHEARVASRAAAEVDDAIARLDVHRVNGASDEFGVEAEGHEVHEEVIVARGDALDLDA